MSGSFMVVLDLPLMQNYLSVNADLTYKSRNFDIRPRDEEKLSLSCLNNSILCGSKSRRGATEQGRLPP